MQAINDLPEFRLAPRDKKGTSSHKATIKERTMYDEERIVYNTMEDQEWADLLSPARRRIIVGAGLTAAGLTAGNNV